MAHVLAGNICEFPQIRGTILRVPITRTIVFWGPILGSPYVGETTILPYRDSVGFIFHSNDILARGVKDSAITRFPYTLNTEPQTLKP